MQFSNAHIYFSICMTVSDPHGGKRSNCHTHPRPRDKDFGLLMRDSHKFFGLKNGSRHEERVHIRNTEEAVRGPQYSPQYNGQGVYCGLSTASESEVFLIFTTQLYQYFGVFFFIFALFSDDPEATLPKYSQTAIFHAAHFWWVVNNVFSRYMQFSNAHIYFSICVTVSDPNWGKRSNCHTHPRPRDNDFGLLMRDLTLAFLHFIIG